MFQIDSPAEMVQKSEQMFAAWRRLSQEEQRLELQAIGILDENGELAAVYRRTAETEAAKEPTRYPAK
jgi:hypothetical protein